MKIKGILVLLVAVSLSVSACGENATVEQLSEQAATFKAQGEYNKAINIYQDLMKQYPTSPEKEVAKAQIELLQTAQEADEPKLRAEIEKLESQEKFSNAIILYNALLQRFPKSDKIDEVLHKLGLIYLNSEEQYDKAITSYQRLLTEFPQSNYSPQSQFMIGYIYANHIKDLEKARQTYEIFKNKYPEHELVASVDWELDHLGQDIGEIDIFSDSTHESNSTHDHDHSQHAH